MIQLTHVTLRRGVRVLFEGATFQAHSGQRLGLVGANGTGKSSLFALLQGELETDAGDVSISPGLEMAHVRQESPHGDQSALDYVLDGDPELRRVQSGIAAAEGGSALCEHELHALYESMERIDGYGAEARAGRLLHGLGFAADEVGNPVQSFSGGWRMRLNLAQALMCRSDILLLDEPTNHLDLPAILWLERQLKAYEGILVVISHDRDFLDGVCTRILHIEHQAITAYTGNYSEFESRRAEQLAQQQALFERQQKDIKHLQSFVDRFRYKASKAKQAQSRLKMMERMQRIAPAHADSPFRFQFLAPGKQPQHLLKLDAARLGYGDSTILDGVGLSIAAGDRMGLLGVNGAGKSTLVKALADGTTVLDGERVAHRDTRIGYFAQHQLDQLNLEESAYDHIQRLMPGDREADLRNYLGRFGFSGERIFEPVAPFSGGEKARLVLALMIRQQPNLLLLDEPTNHLDLEMRQALSIALMEYEGALVVIAHDRHLLRSVCDDLLIVHDGGVEVFDRSLDDYAAWLREHEAGAPGREPATDSPASAPGDAIPVSEPDRESRREQRRREAERRQRLKPLADKVKKIEREMTRLRETLTEIETELSDEALYADPARKGELTERVRLQGETRSAIEALEWEWLDASERLEAAD